MKKFVSIVCSAALMAALAGCGSSSSTSAASSSSTSASSSGKTYKVAIVKQLQHASLDEIADAITAELDALAEENGVTIEYGDVYDGQNDQSQLTTIANQIASDDVDVVIPIATLAAQTMAANMEDTPIVFAAISDPEAADLTGIDNVTGTSDALDTEKILDMMLAQNPDVKTVGLLYSKSETNSATPIEEAKAYLDEKGISYVEATGNTTDEIQSAVSTLVAQDVDAVFTPTDNVVMAAELSIADTLAEAGIPHYTGADSFVRNGAFATCGVNYTDLGTITADLAYQVMTEGVDSLDDFTIDGTTKKDNYYVVNGSIVTVNTETAATGGFSYDMFSDFGEVNEVTTTKE
jgi:putative ABC transport system substrate-binding protein